MAAYLEPIWDEYCKHRNLDMLRDDILTYPWYESPALAEESLLMRAVQTRNLQAVELLISMGESVLLPASNGFSFLHVAIDEIADADADQDRDDELAILIALLEAGADPNILGADGTPLHRAVCGSVDAARILLSHGADIEARMLVDGELTPLMFAVMMGQPSMVRFLLDSGADQGAMSRSSLTRGPMTLREILNQCTRSHVDEIRKLLND